MNIFNFVVWGIFFFILIIKILRSIRIVPTKSAYVVERLGRYSKTLGPGFHVLVPFLEKVAYIQDLKEETITVPPQTCFTTDNVQVEVDGVIYISVMDPVKASYGITNYRFASIQLAQTTMRSVIGTLELDKTFEERDIINSKIVGVLNEVGMNWGINVHRYEVKNIVPPETVRNAMEQQMRAERERRAVLAQSEGDKQSRINNSEGFKMEAVNKSEGEMQKRINEAEGKAREIESIANATAEAIEKLASAIIEEGGEKAVQLRLSEQFLTQLRGLAKAGTSILLPTDLTRLDSLLASLGILPTTQTKTKPVDQTPSRTGA
jgi:regulator of protease activity HflC (stomatin/prohibitin superfamily)